jgi:hypothetical protein
LNPRGRSLHGGLFCLGLICFLGCYAYLLTSERVLLTAAKLLGLAVGPLVTWGGVQLQRRTVKASTVFGEHYRSVVIPATPHLVGPGLSARSWIALILICLVFVAFAAWFAQSLTGPASRFAG